MGILEERFGHLNLTFSIGGQISFDVMPKVRGHAQVKSRFCRRLHEMHTQHPWEAGEPFSIKRWPSMGPSGGCCVGGMVGYLCNHWG